MHLECTTLKLAPRSTSSIKCFFYTSRWQLISAALELFMPNHIKIFYREPVGTSNEEGCIGNSTNKIFEKNPCYTQWNIKRSVKARDRIGWNPCKDSEMMRNYWMKIQFFSVTLIPSILIDNSPSLWKQLVEQTLEL